MTKQIPVKYKDEVHFAIVDDEDFEYLSSFKWYLSFSPRKYSPPKKYAKRVIVLEPKSPGGRKRQGASYMHRDILKPPQGYEPDHKDGDGLNCTRDNLRLATHSQNSVNRNPNLNLISGYRGVSPYYKNRWVSQITVNKKVIRLGVFLSPITAAYAYDEAAIKYHGEFARTNF